MENLFLQLLEKHRDSQKSRFLILIGGCSRSGKSTLAEYLKQAFVKQDINTIIVKLDNWLLGINERKGDEMVRE